MEPRTPSMYVSAQAEPIAEVLAETWLSVMWASGSVVAEGWAEADGTNTIDAAHTATPPLTKVDRTLCFRLPVAVRRACRL
ncbi:hypothetical protein GCM10011410_20610 [Hoyosella rhizosphaerae]|uniref:Uncharacterized protein n=1 Tax=Hoyosella rhizosphaerae TaxID=1755582 RepID=A0A916XF89_9ACTN|nr:hypothetical protein GCM10011410_20610 [Hoyosella rhizosphaerae]